MKKKQISTMIDENTVNEFDQICKMLNIKRTHMLKILMHYLINGIEYRSDLCSYERYNKISWVEVLENLSNKLSFISRNIPQSHRTGDRVYMIQHLKGFSQFIKTSCTHNLNYDDYYLYHYDTNLFDVYEIKDWEKEIDSIIIPIIRLSYEVPQEINDEIRLSEHLRGFVFLMNELKEVPKNFNYNSLINRYHQLFGLDI